MSVIERLDKCIRLFQRRRGGGRQTRAKLMGPFFVTDSYERSGNRSNCIVILNQTAELEIEWNVTSGSRALNILHPGTVGGCVSELFAGGGSSHIICLDFLLSHLRPFYC